MCPDNGGVGVISFVPAGGGGHRCVENLISRHWGKPGAKNLYISTQDMHPGPKYEMPRNGENSENAPPRTRPFLMTSAFFNNDVCW